MQQLDLHVSRFGPTHPTPNPSQARPPYLEAWHAHQHTGQLAVILKLGTPASHRGGGGSTTRWHVTAGADYVLNTWRI
jgi:hypothetical protein